MTKNTEKKTRRKETPKRQENKNCKRTDRLFEDMGLFKDTVLFEYSYSDENLYLSSNACSQINPEILLEIFTDYKEYPPKAGEMPSFEFQMGKMGNPYYWCGCKLTAQWNEEGTSPVRLIGKIQDISYLKAREEALLLQSAKDGLTGTYNKTAFRYLVEDRLKSGKDGWLCMLDIDNFKKINDHFGHLAGDRILMLLGKHLCGLYPEPELVGRVGGDEFVIYTEERDAGKRAEVLLKTVRELMPEAACRLSVSIGIVSCGKDEEDYQQLFSKVDQAMYSAKKAGKNQIAFYRQEEGKSS